MRITGLHVRNLGPLLDVKLDLAPLTVLVGPNASGKSTLLAALDPECKLGAEQTFQRRGGTPKVTWQYADGGSTAKARHQAQILRLDLRAMRSPTGSQRGTTLGKDGAGLVNLLDTIPRRKLEALSRTFTELVPEFGDVDVRPAAGAGTVELTFQDRWRPDLWYPASEVSDGTLFALAVLALSFQDPRPDVVAIEEPERGLHPWLLARLVEQLRALTERGDAQLVMATQSAELLDHLRPEEVRFLRRDPATGATEVRTIPVGEPRWESVLEEYRGGVGELWLTGAVGGVPGH